MAAQIASTSIFLIMFLFILWDKFERHLVTLAAGGSTLVLVFGVCMHSPEAAMRALNLGQMFTVEFWYHRGEAAAASGINWSTILFIAGMMLMVEGLAEAGFFRCLCMAIAKLVRFQPARVLVAFMIAAAVLSMFIDSITVILFLASVTVELGKILQFHPVPVILAEIFCANLGGAATMCGDPPNIIIGTSLGYSFGDFLMNTGVLAGVSLVFVILYFYLCFRRELSGEKGASAAGALTAAQQAAAFVITDRKNFLKGCSIFLLAVLMLVTHSLTGLTVASIGVMIGLLSLAAAGKKGLKLLRQVDYKTLLFFVGLFLVVGGLEETGTLELLADLIERISGGNSVAIIVIIIWMSGLASAFVDNIPFAATMIPVIRSLANLQGIDLSVLAWSLAIGTDIGGSATPIGASANVVGTSVAAREGYPIRWKYYCTYMVPASLIVLGLSTAMIWVRYF